MIFPISHFLKSLAHSALAITFPGFVSLLSVVLLSVNRWCLELANSYSLELINCWSPAARTAPGQQWTGEEQESRPVGT